MPLTYEVSRSIAAPPERVWALLTDSGGYTGWNPAVVSLEGPIELGRKLRLVSVVNPKRTFTPKVTALEPSRRMVWSDGMPLGLFKGERTYTLSPVGDGTEFAMRETFTGLLAPMITKAIPDMTESFGQFAEGLKRAAEAGA